MKRFLAWLVLIACYIVFCILVKLDLMLFWYLLDLYGQLSAFLKLVIIIFGGSFILGVAIAPLYYGIPLTYAASEAVYESKHGVRYIVLGILITLSCIGEMLTDFSLRDIIIAIYGVALFIYGKSMSE